MKGFDFETYVIFALLGLLAFTLWLASSMKPLTYTSNQEIKTMLLETQRNQLELAAMVLYSEDRIKETIEQSRPRPLLPEVR